MKIPDRVRPLLPRRHPLVWWLWHVLLVVVAVVVSAVFGVTTASARGALGPHETQFNVTTDNTITVDVGPLGTLQLDSQLPGPFGARAVVQEIPQDATGVNEVDSLAALQDDLEQYVGLFHGISQELESVANALVADALRRAEIMFAVLVLGGLCLRGVVGRARRDELAAPVLRYPKVAMVVVAVLVVGG
ncbi:MAG: metallophosphoesterase, partial [Micrococcales bacterium]|nr:metallophosphoesterase [Micrococcales bacterium]